MTSVRELAHARTGDKGGTADLTVIAHDDDAFARLRVQLTASAVADHFADLPLTTVDRYELPRLRALKFVLHGALGTGVTTTLALDPHGKALSSCLLALELPESSSPEKEPRHA